MPRLPTVTEIRLENLVACLTPAVTLLNELNDAFGSSFVQPISNTVASLLELVQVLRVPMRNAFDSPNMPECEAK